MPIELSIQSRKDAIASIRRYVAANLPDEIGDLPAGMLLDFFLEDIGPLIYNKAVVDAQGRMQARIAEVDSELYTDPLQYWPRQDQKRRKPRS